MRKRTVVGISAGVVVGTVYGPKVVKAVKAQHDKFMLLWNLSAEEKGVSTRENIGDVLKNFKVDYYHREFNEIIQSIKW